MKKLLLAFALLPAVLFAQTKPINNLVIQNSGTAISGLVKANGTSPATAATANTDYLPVNAPAITGLATWQAGIAQTFNPNGTHAGLNVGSVSGNPSSPANGDLWYDSSGNALNARINGVTVALGAGGGGSPGGATGNVQYNNTTFAGSANFTFASNVVSEFNPGIAATSTDGIVIANATAAANGAQQWSPRLHLSGQGWHTGSGGGSTAVDIYMELRPIQGVVFPSFTFAMASAFSAGAGTDFATSDGVTWSAPDLKATGSTASTTHLTGAIISGGGIGATGQITTAASFVTDTVGGTLKVKSGANSKANTFTLIAGVATVGNTSITANSVVHAWIKTVGGTITGALYYPTTTPGTGFTVAEDGGTSDTSTYNYWIEENN